MNRRMSSFYATIKSETNGFAHRIGPVVFALVATVFTWGLIDSARRSMLQPWLLSQLPVHDTKIEINGEVIHLADFYAAAIVWAFVMLILLCVWLIYTKVTSNHG
jgi:hypothetical protein